MPTTELPLTDDDRDRLARKAARSIAAIRWGAALALVAHIGTGVFLSTTPTDFSHADMLVLAVMLVAFAGVPFWLYVWDTRRTVSRVLQWRADGIKACLTGRVTTKPNERAVTVEGLHLGVWPGVGPLREGQSVQAEFFSDGSGHAPLRCVLRINGHDNPYFDTVLASGPPGP